MIKRKQEIWDHYSAIKRENLLNELKGHLFEYLVALSLSQIHHIENLFRDDIDGDLQKILQQYEQVLREYDLSLLRALPDLAQRTATFIQEKCQLSDVKKILLLGKSKSAQKLFTSSEADLGIVRERQFIPISLKLCKYSSFVNTKNGGIFSFLYNYFPFQESQTYQEELNSWLATRFHVLVSDLYLMADLGPVALGEGFDSRWKEAGLSELPGELPDEMHSVVLKYYDDVKNKLYYYLSLFLSTNRELFCRSLFPLWGMDHFGSENNLIQIKCFHCVGKEAKRHQFKSLVWCDESLLKEDMQSLELIPAKPGISSILIKGKFTLLQMRIKPMNRFTVMGLKINCSVKEI